MKHIEEARRYLDNARQLLSDKARKEDGFYQDTKYVKMAGHAAYAGVLVALDGLFGKKTKGRKDVDWYKQQLTGIDKKQLSRFTAVYNTLHLSLSYDGNPDANVAKAGLEEAGNIIDWVATKSPATA